jgi:ABC-type amino acid transport substrate-binding protein
MVSKIYPNTEELLAKFNAALERIKQQGMIEQIVQKYYLADD